MKLNIKKQQNQFLLQPSSFATSLLDYSTDWFEPDYWLRNDAVVGESKGRHTTWFVKPKSAISQTEWVLRHYYRGGMVAKISKDNFFYTGLSNTRPFKELSLLSELATMRLPVPVCVGARVVKQGLTYTADLIMEKLDAKDLVGLLKSQQLPESLWREVGRVIARFHQQCVYHADLNAHNIMIDSANKVWLIDFDRCEIRKIKPAWQQQNLARLLRSFNKENALASGFHFSDHCWQWLLEGYLSNEVISE